MTIRILFLLSPVMFGGFLLLVGDTLNWIKKHGKENKLKKTRIVLVGR